MQNEFDYRKYLALLNKHKRLFAVVALLIMTGAAVASYVLPKKYGANSTFFIEKNVLNELLRPTNSKTEMEDALKGLNYSLKSRSLFVKVMNDLDVNISSKSDSQLEALIMDLQKNTECKLNKEEGLITVSFTDKSPRFARDFVNALVRRYIEQNLSAKREESYGASTFLAEQAASVKEKLDKIENEIGRLRAEKGAALGVEPAGIQAEINTGQQRLDELILRRSQLEASRNQLRSNNPAKNRVTALQRRLDELRVEYTENYPEVLKVKADIEAAQKDIGKGTSTSVADPQELARVEAELSAVRASEASQRSIIANSRGLMHANPAARTAMEKLEQEKFSYRAMYEQLMARQGQSEVSKQMAVQDKSTTFRIVDPAVLPIRPIFPNRVMFILMGIAAGIAAGFGLILAMDFFDSSVKSVDTLKSLGINVLAVIPKISDPQATEKERRRDLRLYLASGTYFSMVVFLLALEILDVSPVERVIGLISG